jgi:hypothetical protein
MNRKLYGTEGRWDAHVEESSGQKLTSHHVNTPQPQVTYIYIVHHFRMWLELYNMNLWVWFFIEGSIHLARIDVLFISWLYTCCCNSSHPRYSLATSFSYTFQLHLYQSFIQIYNQPDLKQGQTSWYVLLINWGGNWRCLLNIIILIISILRIQKYNLKQWIDIP